MPLRIFVLHSVVLCTVFAPLHQRTEGEQPTDHVAFDLDITDAAGDILPSDVCSIVVVSSVTFILWQKSQFYSSISYFGFKLINYAKVNGYQLFFPVWEQLKPREMTDKNKHVLQPQQE